MRIFEMTELHDGGDLFESDGTIEDNGERSEHDAEVIAALTPELVLEWFDGMAVDKLEHQPTAEEALAVTAMFTVLRDAARAHADDWGLSAKAGRARWREVGEAMGITGQSAQQRLSRRSRQETDE